MVDRVEVEKRLEEDLMAEEEELMEEARWLMEEEKMLVVVKPWEFRSRWGCAVVVVVVRRQVEVNWP